MQRSTRLVAAAVAAVLIAACDAPRPSNAPGPSQTAAQTPASTDAAPSGPSATLQPGPPAAVPSSADLIRAAVDAGELDQGTGLLFRLYSVFNDQRLPAAYQGPWEEDALAIDESRAAFESLPLDQQAAIRPFLLRPSHPDSHWSLAAGPVAGATTVRYRLAQATGDCDSVGWARLDLQGIPVTIWGRCDAGAGGTWTFGSMVDAVDTVATTMTEVWPELTAIMGPPLLDKYKGPARAPDEPIEAGDQRLDIYVVPSAGVPARGNRDVEAGGAYGVAPQASPVVGLKTSTYIVLDVAVATSGKIIRNTVAHEFFHSLQAAHNRRGVVHCPYPNVAAACRSGAFFWFEEASATWAAAYAAEDTRPDNSYLWYRSFLAVTQPLADETGGNDYRSWAWPMFMEQERGARSVGAAWRALEGTTTWTANQAAVDAQLPFATHFGDFAVRVWNEELQPGDPIRPRFKALYRDFPAITPAQGGLSTRFMEPDIRLDPFVMPSVTTTADIPELWAAYYDVSFDSAARRVTFNFDGLRPNGNVDVDLLVYVKDVGWQRRPSKDEPPVTELCLDKPADAVERMILVLSNHSQTPNDHVTGSWQAQVDAGGCLTASDAIVYSLTHEVGQPGDPYYSTYTETLTLQLRLAPSPDGSGLADAGTTFRAEFTGSSVLQTVDPTCSQVTEIRGGRGGTFPPPDDPSGQGVDAIVMQVFDPPDGQTFRPDGWWLMSLGATVELDLQTTTTSCIGTNTENSTQRIILPPCDGTEVASSDRARVFDFNCVVDEPGYHWSVIGKVSVS